ncbi:hypothetical protein JXA48_04855 [Candidatus Woesearchaeota archaeon]|nr:hypothetical protein [Candidatus Woesearchaeota archaeon]
MEKNKPLDLKKILLSEAKADLSGITLLNGDSVSLEYLSTHPLNFILPSDNYCPEVDSILSNLRNNYKKEN